MKELIYGLTSIFNSFRTKGDKISIAGNATIKAKLHACIHFPISPSITPILIVVTTKDIKPDISPAMIKANAICSYLLAMNINQQMYLA